jgi:phosphoglycolate phosphatase
LHSILFRFIAPWLIMKPDKLLLWDIDGTLIHNGIAGVKAIERAWKQLTGITIDLRQIDYTGRTDKMIGHMLFDHCKIPFSQDLLHKHIEAYLTFLEEELEHTADGERLPGIIDILHAVSQREDICQGLLTGNMERGAEAKLAQYELWHFFEFGAYADDSHIRDELGPHALRRASQKYGYDFSPKRVFIIGDTPHDIQCARVIEARAVAVATGKYSVEQLQSYNPDLLLNDLTDTDGFLQAIDRLAALS